MILVRRAGERQHERRRRQESWRTFFPLDPSAHPASGYGSLLALDEHRLSPGARVPQYAQENVDILTYVREGTLNAMDRLGRTSILRAGGFQRLSAGNGVRHNETNASSSDSAHAFHVVLGLRTGEIDPSRVFEQQRFSAADCRDRPRIVGSPDAREGSLRVHVDTRVSLAIVARGRHVAHEQLAGRRAWLHLVHGEVRIGDLVLTTGDGVGFTGERAVSFTARTPSELLLFDIGD